MSMVVKGFIATVILCIVLFLVVGLVHYLDQIEKRDDRVPYDKSYTRSFERGALFLSAIALLSSTILVCL